MKKLWAYIALVIAFVCLWASDTVWSTPYYKWDVKVIPILLICASVALGIPSGLSLIFCLLRRFITYVMPNAHDPSSLTLVWLGIAVFVLMGLFPPWIIECKATAQMSVSPSVCRYRFILTPPEFPDLLAKAVLKDTPFMVFSSRCDFGRLSIQWLMVAIVPAGLIFTLRDITRGTKDNKPEI